MASPAIASDLYFSASGMAVFMENDSLSGGDLSGPVRDNPTSLSAEINAGNLVLKGRGAGYGATAAVGKKFLKGIRGEIEFAYRSGGFEDLVIRELSTEHGVDIDFVNAGYSTRSLLTNLIWDIPLTERFSPYIGGGVGLAWTTASEGVVHNGRNGLAWQLMGGISYRATDQIELFGGYRYLATESQVRVWDHVFVDVDTHSAEFGVRYFLDSPEKNSTEGRSLSALSNQAEKNPFYIGISGSVVQQQDMGVRTTSFGYLEGINTRNYAFKAGYGLELALGYKFCSICRVELEYSFKYSEVSTVTDRAPSKFDLFGDPADNAIGEENATRRSRIHALLINLYADLDIGNIKKKYGILPFAGIGLGGMYIDLKNNTFVGSYTTIDSIVIAKARWAAQMSAGVGYSLTEQVILGAQYKYLAMLGSELFGETNKAVVRDLTGYNSFADNIGIHSYGLFARYNF